MAPSSSKGRSLHQTQYGSLRHNVTAYDAAYLALAEALDAPLVTCDARLARAGGHTARVDLIGAG